MASTARGSDYDATFVTELYQIFFDREPDVLGFENHLRGLRAGRSPHEVVADFLNSDEYRQRTVISKTELFNIREIYPEYYYGAIYMAITDERINLMETLIRTHGYYDHFGVWSPSIDPDKLKIAQLVQAVGANNCLEIGCFNGPVLSVLHDRGVEVTGIDLSHLAFVVAFPNIRDRLLYGDLLSVTLDKKYDCILLFDVLEHLNPLRLGSYVQRLREVLAPNGIIILNSPMFGTDDVFGTVFEQSQQEWRDIGNRHFYRHWPCDAQGWPDHGHLVWASPNWWTEQFERHGLSRLREIEEAVQSSLSGYFSWAPARKSMFFLSHRDAVVDTGAISAAIGQHEWS